MDLAVIVVSYNTRELLRGCLESVFRSLSATPGLDARIWVVDNASVDGSADMVRDAFPQAQLVASAENLGFAGGNNLALRLLGFGERAADEAERPRHVLLLNPDTAVVDDALAGMVGFLDDRSQVGACGPRLSYPDGSFQHGAFRFPTLAQIALDFFPPPGRLNRPLLNGRINGRYDRKLYEGADSFPVDFVLGAALTVRSEAISQVGLLDEGYFMYCEEMDWQRRLGGAGWTIQCVPAAHIVHYGGASTGQFRGPMLVALWRSRLRFFRRYYSPMFNRLACRLIALGAQSEIRRAVRQNVPDLVQRVAAYEEVKRLAQETAGLSARQVGAAG